MKKVVLASSNQGKLKEIQAMLDSLDIQLITQSEFDINPVEETGLTFVENAILKARHASLESGLPAIADDSGLEVDALQGAPGILSARYGGIDSSDEINMHKLLQDMEAIEGPHRQARFQCVMVYMRHGYDPTPVICQGSWDGFILFEPQGQNGFGYDPLFYLPEQNCSAAELEQKQKNRLSHRGKALKQLILTLQDDQSIAK